MVVLFGEVVQPSWRKCITEGGLWQFMTLLPFRFALFALCLRLKMRSLSLLFQVHAANPHNFNYGVFLWNQGKTKSPESGLGYGVLQQP